MRKLRRVSFPITIVIRPEYRTEFITILSERVVAHYLYVASEGHTFSLAYSALACLRTGMLGSASFKTVRNSS
jgi:hypothetical protein